MILRLLICAALIPTAVPSGMASPPQDSSRLTDIACVAHDSLSRMTFSFNGPVTYSVRKDGDELVMRFSGMTAAKALLGLRRYPEGGMISSVVVTPLPDVELAITVVMKGSAPYRFVHARSANRFSLEVIGRQTTLTSAAASRPPKTTASKSTVKPALKKVEAQHVSRAVVDIAGMARAQLQESERDARSGQGVSPVAGDRHPVEAGLMLVSIVVFPLIAGVVILFLLYQRRRRRHRDLELERTPLVFEPIEEKPLATLDEVSVPDLSTLFEEPSDLPAMAHVDDESTNDRPFQIAQSMIQGNEQYALAKRFAGEASELTRNKIRKACRTKTARTHRVRVAKRLGVGKGEVELALKLGDIAAKRARKEKKR